MRLSKSFIPTMKETPSDAVVPSHILMLRSGMMRQLTAGVYSYLPLGYRSLRKAMTIIREEMNAIGAQEFHLPALNPGSLWEATGRRNVPDFILGIRERELVLAPTHEEVIADIASAHIHSYKDLPQIWYQIQTKFRNEPRPRSGVLRTRQFTMKDAYSLDSSFAGLDVSYDKHADAYRNIFTRAGIKFFIVGASTGAMGGSASQEFMISSEYGEDTIVQCSSCAYAANSEVAVSKLKPLQRILNSGELEKIHTPNVKTIDELMKFLSVPEEKLAKSIVYRVDNQPTLILMVGNDQLNESKLRSALKAQDVSPMTEEDLHASIGAHGGSIGPVGLNGFMIIADERLKGVNGLVSGANQDDFHYKNIDLDRDARIENYFDLRVVQNGETCKHCDNALKVAKAIELGHIFKLGTKYSEALNVKFLDENQTHHPVVMGSYGIGVERVLACYLEQNHDAHGIIWNSALAPFEIHLIGVNMTSDTTRLAAEELYEAASPHEFEVLYDDRSDVSPGFKFKDADLLGMPLQVIIGEKGLKTGKVEVKNRRTGERTMLPYGPPREIYAALRAMLAQM